MTSQIIYKAALSGIVTGVLLGLARIAGETAPLLFTALNNQFWSASMAQPLANVPVVIFQYAMSPYDEWHALAWAGALVLTVFVLGLNLMRALLRPQGKQMIDTARPSATDDAASADLAAQDRRARPRLLLRQDARAQRRRPRGSGQRGDRDHRPVGLRQVDPAARRSTASTNFIPTSAPRARSSSTGATSSIRRYRAVATCAARSAWCSRSRRRSPPASARTSPSLSPITSGCRRRSSPTAIEDALRQAALWDEVKDKLDASALSLSGGQQQRLCIARTLAVRPEIILLDEPTSALDPISTAKIEELIHELRERFTIVIVTHNMQQAARVSQRTAFFHLGELIEFGDTSQIFTNPHVQRTQDYITGRYG